MITEIQIHNINEMTIKAGRLPSPAAEWTTIKISIGAIGVSGQHEWQVITLFWCDTPEQKFEDSELASKIKAFNRTTVFLDIDPITGSLTTS